jgi:hypothetical protein
MFFENEKKQTKPNNIIIPLSKQVSYSNYKYSQVSSAWKKSCRKGDLETSSRWVVEIILSHWTHIWWEDIVIFCATQIHIENPKISCLLLKIFNENKNILIESFSDSFHLEIKDTLFLVLGTCCFSPKAISLPSLLINLSEFELSNGICSLQSNPFTHESLNPYKNKFNNHPLFLSLLSVFIGHILNFNCNQSIRIISWIIFIEKNKKFKHFIPTVGKNNDDSIDHNDWVVLLWKILIILSHESPEKHSSISAWSTLYFTLFKNNPSKNYIAKRNKYLPLFIASVFLFTETNLKSIKCIQNFSIIQKAINNSHSMFDFVVQEKKNKMLQSALGF